MEDRELAQQIIAVAAAAGSHDESVALFSGLDWPQAAISAMATGIEDGVVFDAVLIREALARWTPDMGPVLARQFAGALTHAE